jgi:hypothetical protein
MQPDGMWKSRPGKRIRLHNVIQEFEQLVGSRANQPNFVGQLDVS